MDRSEPTNIVNGKPMTNEEYARWEEMFLAVLAGEDAEARAHDAQMDLIRPLDATEALAALLCANPSMLKVVPDKSLARMAPYCIEWDPTLYYMRDDIVAYDEVVYRCLQAHQSQESWAPDVSPSLWAKVLTEAGNVLPWEQPSSTNPYMKGDQVLWDGNVWESDVDNNVWMPGVYGWTNLGPISDV